MRKLLKMIAAALLAVPVLAWKTCAATGRLILQAIAPPAPQGMTTEAGEEAEEAIELAQARAEQQTMRPKSDAENQVQTVLRYAAAVISGSRMPVVEDDDLRRWLADLTPAGIKRLFKATPGQIARHLRPQCPGDHLDGIPSLYARPMSAAPVRDGSKAALEALATAPKPEMCSDGDFRIFHDYPGEDQSTRLRAA